MEANQVRHARTTNAILKKNLIMLAGGVVLIVAVFFARIGQDVALVVPKITSPLRKTVPAKTDISALLIDGAKQSILPAQIAKDMAVVIESGNPIVDLSGFYAAIRQNNHREAVDRWYQGALQQANETNNTRARNFLTSTTTRIRIRVALDVADFGENAFLPLYESGAEIDLEKSLRPMIRILPDPEEEILYKEFQEALEARHQILLKAAKYYADEDGSPSITEAHMMRARQAFAVELSKKSEE